MPMRKVGATKTRKRELEFDYEGGRGGVWHEAWGMFSGNNKLEMTDKRRQISQLTFFTRKKNRKKKNNLMGFRGEGRWEKRCACVPGHSPQDTPHTSII